METSLLITVYLLLCVIQIQHKICHTYEILEPEVKWLKNWHW